MEATLMAQDEKFAAVNLGMPAQIKMKLDGLANASVNDIRRRLAEENAPHVAYEDLEVYELAGEIFVRWNPAIAFRFSRTLGT